MSWKLALQTLFAVIVAGFLCLISPRIGGLALIVIALGAVAAVAYKLL